MHGIARLLLAGLVAATPPLANAAPFELTMTGFLDARSGIVAGATTTAFAGTTPFTFTALFDTSSPNLVAPLPPGFKSYAPSSATLQVAGTTYAVVPYGAATPLGIGVAIFDDTTPFGVPNRYGVGFIQNPLADGAGMVADFLGANPPYKLAATGVVPATFVGFQGVGVSSGVCTQGTPANCQAHANTPIPLLLNGVGGYALALGNYESNVGPEGAGAFAVRITAVPEPGSAALLLVGLAAAFAGRRRR